MRLPKFDYFAPQTLEEALRLLTEKGEGARLLAGGTDLLIRMKAGLLKPQAIIALEGIEALKAIRYQPKVGLTIGATAKLSEVADHPDIKKHYPAVAYAALETANVQIRNMGTVGGNLCNAAPSADNAPTLIAMKGEALLAGPKGERRLPLDQFFKGPRLTALAPDEIMTGIFVPIPPPHSGTAYQHVSARGKVDIAAVCVGVMAIFDGETCREARIVLGAVGPIPLRAKKTEGLVQGQQWTPELIEKAGKQAVEEAKPISDVRASAAYRKMMVAVLTRRALLEAQKRARKR
ncbi:MAG: xanthine dehydrogenase family protein subunit M [Deltaproteobacteria bacterium]|nr:xanthine dehydrogenase family protein subunit M [Deltaproteobacteria bacterium]